MFTFVFQVINTALLLWVMYMVMRFLVTMPKRMANVEKDISTIKDSMSKEE